MGKKDEQSQGDADRRTADLVAAVMSVERKFGHALRGAKSERLEGVKEAIEIASKAAK